MFWFFFTLLKGWSSLDIPCIILRVTFFDVFQNGEGVKYQLYIYIYICMYVYIIHILFYIYDIYIIYYILYIYIYIYMSVL